MKPIRTLLPLLAGLLLAGSACGGAPPESPLAPGAVKPVRSSTPLVVNGRAPVILAAADGAARAAAESLRAGLLERWGVEARLATRLAEADPGQQTAIALGNMLDNELLTRLYWSRYTFEDAQFPGRDGFTLHTVYDPHPWGGGQDVIVLGASQPENLGLAVSEFLGHLRPAGTATEFPYTRRIAPTKPRPPQGILAKPVDPSFAGFRVNAEQYLKTGEEAYARQAIAALDIMVETYRKNPRRHTPWPEETTSGEIFAAWDAFEECPLISLEKRRDYLAAFLAWCRDLTHCSYEYRAIDEKFTATWNHTTFALLGLYYAGRYFDRHFDLPEGREWLRKARLGFQAQARSWKPLEDADSYLVLTMGHTIAYSLADWDLRFLEHGLLKRYADYVVTCGDTRQWPAGFGDSGYGMAPTMATAALPVAYWWTRDGGYRWLLEHAFAEGWPNPFWSGIEPGAPARFTGLNVVAMDRQIYDDTQRRPTYGEAFAVAEVPFEQAWDKASFRENWDPDGQYLLLDGLGRGKHLHFDTNGITTFVQDGERWLIDHDYLVRNTTEHTMLSVLRDGRCVSLVPSLAAMTASGDLSWMASTHSAIKGYNGVDWNRRVLWNRGRWFLVQDTVAARDPGSYDLDLTWKTIDRGDQRLDETGQFVARRPLAERAVSVVEDARASGGQAVLFSAAQGRLSFPVNLEPGEWTVSCIAHGQSTSSDSLYVGIDGGKPAMAGLPLNEYAPSRPNQVPSTGTIRCRIATGGTHAVDVSLREAPPVRIDRIEFRRNHALEQVFEAEALLAATEASRSKAIPLALHINPARPVRAWITNHVRQGISVPVSILHQRISSRLTSGEQATFCSLIYATGAKHPREFEIKALRPGVQLVSSGGSAAVAGFGPDRSGRWQCDADAWLAEEGQLGLIAARSLGLGTTGITFEPAANASLDAAAGKLTLCCDKPVTVTVRGGGTANGQSRLDLPAGQHGLAVSGLDATAVSDARLGKANHPLDQVAPAANPKPAVKPVWSTELVKDSPVFRITPTDLNCDGDPLLLVACGQSAHAIQTDGKLRWSYPTAGTVRDVALARLAKDRSPTVLVSSADTYLHRLDATGRLQRKDLMTGIYFNQDHGERPWGLYCTRGVDTNGDGLDELLVTTLASMESQGLTPDGTKLWRTLAAYHGCIDLAIDDVDGNGRPEIVIGNKYGAVYVLTPEGKVVMNSATSIGDETFGLADLNGDGRKEIVHGSSTGDLVAVDLKKTVLWRFDNFGYPVERIACADLTGDGLPEILVASGTGYVYCLDALGQPVWQRHLGLAVHDLALAGDRLFAGTEDGEIHALDSRGVPLWTCSLGSSVNKLVVCPSKRTPLVIAGCANGRLVAFPVNGPAPIQPSSGP